MYHIIYSKRDNDYTLMYATSADRLLYKQGFGWHTRVTTLLNQPAFNATDVLVDVADSSWIRNSVYSSPTYPTITSVMSTNPELLI